MSVRLATALGLVRGLFSLSLFGETSVSETNKEEGSVSSLFLLPMGVIALHCGMLTKYGRQRLMTVCETLSLSRTERFPLKRGLSAPLFYDNGKAYICSIFLPKWYHQE